ncbi:MAG: phosphatase PAP2 family protein [Alphaproteobacteria bacterium]|nr:phosphatase PAP2 family protein [Alphaproteobacteria bacterium]
MLSHPILSALRDRFTRLEIVPLLGFLLPAFLIYATIEMMDEVSEGEADPIDRAILATMREPGAPHEPIGPEWFIIAMKDITSLGSTTVLTLIVLSAAGYLLISRRYRLAGIFAASMIAGTLFNALLKNIFERARPEFVAAGVPIDSFSFPSGHAMLSAITYLTLGALLARSDRQKAHKGYIVGLAIVITLLIGSSRLYLGVHYPTDVLAGWSIGALWALGTWWIARRLAPSRTGDVA